MVEMAILMLVVLVLVSLFTNIFLVRALRRSQAQIEECLKGWHASMDDMDRLTGHPTGAKAASKATE